MPEDSETIVVPPAYPPHDDDALNGPYGLRAGWSLGIFVALIGVSLAMVSVLGAAYIYFAPTMATAFEKAVYGVGFKEHPPYQVLFTHGIYLLIFLLASWVMSKIERRRFGVYGLGGTSRISDCLKGLVTGLVALSLLVAFLWRAHLLVFDGYNVTGSTAIIYGFKWLAAFSLVGVTEEFMFRGYFQYTLARGLSGILPRGYRYRRAFGFWLTASTLSALFFLKHTENPGESHIGLFVIFLAGLMFVYSLWRTGSLWWAIGFHTAWDWAQSFLYGVGDSGVIAQGRLLSTHPTGNILYSGGVTGPEGSLYVIPTLALVAVFIRLTVPKRPQPPLTPENLRVPARQPALSVVD